MPSACSANNEKPHRSIVNGNCLAIVRFMSLDSSAVDLSRSGRAYGESGEMVCCRLLKAEGKRKKRETGRQAGGAGPEGGKRQLIAAQAYHANDPAVGAGLGVRPFIIALGWQPADKIDCPEFTNVAIRRGKSTTISRRSSQLGRCVSFCKKHSSCIFVSLHQAGRVHFNAGVRLGNDRKG